MKKTIIFCALLSACFSLKAQGTGIPFIKAAGFGDVLEEAKKENKYVFVDCYATWCAPCRYMDREVFPDPAVGAYFSEHFISVRVQMDRTKTDGDSVRRWYPDAKSLTEKYGIGAFPTYLFFSPGGKPVHRLVGGAKNGEEFLGLVRNVFVPDSQYYTVISRYTEHAGDSAWLHKAYTMAVDLADNAGAAAISGYYIDAMKDPYAPDNQAVIKRETHGSRDKGFRFLTGDTAMVMNVVVQEEFMPLFKKDAPPLDWKAFTEHIKSKYAVVTDKALAPLLPTYYLHKPLLASYDSAILAYMKKYGREMAPLELNDNAWDVFTVSDNKRTLTAALGWSKRAVDVVGREPGSDYMNYLDTYARLHYKLGDTAAAIRLEKTALAIARKEQAEKKIKLFEGALAKMEAGEKTW